jgi:hypothetical protein
MSSIKSNFSEGEEFIMDFFKLYGIKYQYQKTIEGLKDDSKAYRVADFYLPKYNVYLEFNGQWNNGNSNDRYSEKKTVYLKNKIPCIYIYPENLGILDYTFDKRIQQVLKEHHKEKELLSYQLFKLVNGEYERLFFIGIFIFSFFIIDYNILPHYNLPTIIFLSFLILYQVIKLTFAYFKIFRLNKYPLSYLGKF